MAKNYATIYNSGNDASALNQKFYLKAESTRGTFEAPTGADFFFTLAGGSIEFSQPFESSPHRSGRHNNNIIKKKKETNWNFSTYFNIDSTVGIGVTEIDPAVRELWKSLYGKEDTSGAGIVYTSGDDPSTTFTLLEVGDLWSRQSRGAFVQGGNHQFPGDGEAMTEWTGSAKDAFVIGIGKTTTDNDLGNTVTLQAGEGDRFQEGGIVMLVEADGLTRSADTAGDTFRSITDVTGDVVTLDGAALADANGGAADIFLVYYEPETPVAIDDPQTGLEGSVTIVGLSAQCIRNASVNAQNDHELVNYCFGEDGLAGALFVAGSRFNCEVTIEMNLNHEVVDKGDLPGACFRGS
jgi:hypothetical protein